MLISKCYIRNKSQKPQSLKHAVFSQVPYVSVIPGGIEQCVGPKLTLAPGQAAAVPVQVWAEAGRKNDWCERLTDEGFAKVVAAARSRGKAKGNGKVKPPEEPEPGVAEGEDVTEDE